MKVVSKSRKFDQNSLDHQKMLQHIGQEIDIMKKLCDGKHINIVQLFDLYITVHEMRSEEFLCATCSIYVHEKLWKRSHRSTQRA